MAHFILYSSEIDDHTRFGEIGQEALVTESTPQKLRFGRGPDGKHGTFFFWSDNWNLDAGVTLGYSEAIQEWQRAPGGKFWVGWEKERPVRPCDIRRRTLHHGLPVTLNDGSQWHVPITAALPRTWGVTDDGDFCKRIKPEFREYCELSERVFNQIFRGTVEEGKDAGVVLTEGWDFCCRALALNYRLTPELITVLGLIDDQNAVAIMSASIELDLISEVSDEKKNSEAPLTPAT
jgi:hypothetical protein